jgi:hypothetical protein
MFSSQVTKLEIGLVKAKQQLGEALNEIHEMETMMPTPNGFRNNNLRESHMSDGRGSEESKGDEDSFGSNQSSGIKPNHDKNI